MLVVAAASKLLAGGLSARATGLSRHDALSVGVLLNTRGLVELVALGIGLSAGLLDTSLYAVLVIMAVVTTSPRARACACSASAAPAAERATLGCPWRSRRVEDLQQHLQWAIELEHSTLPPYLSALYSIKDGANQEAVEVIHSVFIEEMLHLTLAANILNAVGGSPQLDTPGSARRTRPSCRTATARSRCRC